MKTYLDDYLAYLRIEKNCSRITIKDYRMEITRFLNHQEVKGSCDLKEIDTSLVRKYIHMIKESRNLSSNSTAKVTAVIKSYFNYLADDGKIEANPTSRIRLPRREKPLPKVLSELEFEKLIACVKYSSLRCRKNAIRDRLILSILYYCGLRKSELMALNWEDLDLGKKTLFIRMSKNKQGRMIPLHSRVMELLDLYLEQRLPLEDHSLVTGTRGKRLSNGSFNNLIRMYYGISGLKEKGYTAHSLRHSFATRLIEGGVNIFMVQRLMGHSSLDSTRIYIHFDDKGFREAIEAI